MDSPRLMKSSSETDGRSPVLKVIHRFTDHPSEKDWSDKTPAANLSPSLAVSTSTAKSPLLHAIHMLTNDPGLHMRLSEESITQARGRLTSLAQGTAACAFGFAGAALIVAMTKVIADKSPEMQVSFQQKWAHLENSISGLLDTTVSHTGQAGEAVALYVKNHEAELRTVCQRALKGVLVGMSLLAMKTRPGVFMVPAKLLLSPASLVATAASVALFTHKPALGVNDPYKRVRTHVTAASSAARKRLETVAKSNCTHTAIYSVIGIRALTQRKTVSGSSRAKLLIPAVLVAACTEASMRAGTDREPECVRLWRETCMQSMQAHSESLRTHLSEQWQRVQQAVKDLVAAGRDFCEENPRTKRGVQAAIVIAVVVAAAALTRGSPRKLAGSEVATEAYATVDNALQNAAQVAMSTVKGLKDEYSVPQWLVGSLERLQALAGQGADVAMAAGSSAAEHVAPAAQGVCRSVSAVTGSLGDHLVTGAGAVKDGAAALSSDIAQRAGAAGGSLAAGATSAAASTMQVASGAPDVLSNAAQRLVGIAKTAPGSVVGAAKRVPATASDIWHALLAALDRSSQLTDEQDRITQAELAIKAAAAHAAATSPKGLDRFAHAVLRPELLIYGAIAAEMHMRGMLPGTRSLRSSAQGSLGQGVIVSGRDVKAGVMHAVRGTRTCVRAFSDAVERTRRLPAVFLSAGAPAEVPRPITAPTQHPRGVCTRSTAVQAEAAWDAPVPNPRVSTASWSDCASSISLRGKDRAERSFNGSSTHAAVDMDGGSGPLAALQDLCHVSVTHTDAGGKYVGGNPAWMINGLESAGLLRDEQLRATAVDISTDMRACVESTIAKTCLPSNASLERAQELFMLEDGVSHLNHGSYGATLKAAQQAADAWRSALESGPSQFMEEVAVPALAAAVSSAADLIGADGRDCVPVTNATTGVTTALAAVPLARGDAIMTLSCAYSAVKTAIGRTAAAAGASVVEVELDMQSALDPQLLVDRVKAALDRSQGRIKAAVLDHIVSFPPVVLPLAELIDTCRAASCMTIVDGAHAIGNIPNLDITRYTLHPDAYVTNLHKWLCAPKGTALLWVSRSLQQRVRPLVVSHAEGLGFAAEHLWAGTTDLSQWLAVPAAVAVHKQLGIAAEHRHRLRILEEGVAALVKVVRRAGAKADTPLVVGGTRTPQCALGNPALDLATFPSMAAVRLPALPGYPVSPSAAQRLRTVLRHDHRIEVPIIAWSGSLWVRVSAALYTTTADFEALAAAITSLCEAQGSAQVNSSNVRRPHMPSVGNLKPPASAAEAKLHQSVDSEASSGNEVSKSLKDFLGGNAMADMHLTHDLIDSKDALRASSDRLTDHLVGFGVEDESDLEASPADLGDVQPANKEDSAMEPVKSHIPLFSDPSHDAAQMEDELLQGVAAQLLTGDGDGAGDGGGAGKLVNDVGDLRPLKGAAVDVDGEPADSELTSPRTFCALERCGRSTADHDGYE